MYVLILIFFFFSFFFPSSKILERDKNVYLMIKIDGYDLYVFKIKFIYTHTHMYIF